MGPAVPSLWFQQALNALNNGARLYADIKEDGDIGPATLGAFRAYLKARGAEASEVMMKALNSLQGARYIELSRTRAANEDRKSVVKGKSGSVSVDIGGSLIHKKKK